MSSLPWIKLYIDDYLSATTALSATEHGAYLLLLMWYYRNGPLPNDIQFLGKVARLRPDSVRKVVPLILQRFFVEQRNDTAEHHGVTSWRHTRADKELAQVIEKSKASSAAARRSHEVRKAGAAVSQAQTPDIRTQNKKPTPPDSDSDVALSGKKERVRVSKPAPTGEPGLVLTEEEIQKYERRYPKIPKLRGQIEHLCEAGGWLATLRDEKGASEERRRDALANKIDKIQRKISEEAAATSGYVGGMPTQEHRERIRAANADLTERRAISASIAARNERRAAAKEQVH